MSDVIEQIFTGMFGGTLIMIIITAAVIFFLRALYGPKGRFRDPKWDESNRRIRQQEAEARERLLKKWQEEDEQLAAGERKGDER